jgi:hypothetical protein
MPHRSVHTLSAALALGALLSARALGAQRPQLTYGAAVGRVGWDDARPTPRNDTPMLQFSLGVAPPRGPLEFRGEVGWLLGASETGPVSLAGDAVLPVTLVAFRPTLRLQSVLTAGLGVYGVGSVGPRFGVNAGAGVGLQGRRLGVFTDVRRHWATHSYVGALGVTVRP